MRFGRDKSKLRGYSVIKNISRILSPICAALFYVCAGLAVIMLVCIPIISFVNVSADEFLLPPFMHKTADGYNILLGNGIRIFTESVTLADIKVAVYAGISVAAAVLFVCAPIFRFASLLTKNIGLGRPFERRNARYINFIGLTIMVGNTAILFVTRFFNYYLVKTFIADSSNVFLQLGVDLYGIIEGAIILFFGYIYGYACMKYESDCASENTQLEVSSEK